MKKNKTNSVSLFYFLNKSQKLGILFLILFSIVTSIFEVISIGSLYQVLNLFADNNNDILLRISGYLGLNDLDLLKFLISLFVIFFIATTFLKIFLAFFIIKFSENLGHSYAKKVFSNILSQNYSYFANLNSSDFISGIINKVNHSIRGYFHPLISIISHLFILTAITISLTFIQGIHFMIFILVIIICYFLITLTTKKTLNLASYNIASKENFIIKYIQETFGSIRDILINDSKNQYIKFFSNYDLSLRKSKIVIAVISGIPRFIIEIFIIIILALYILFFQNIEINQISKNLPFIGVLIYTFQRSLPSINIIYSNLSAIRGSKVSIKDAYKLLNLKPQNKERTTKKVEFEKSLEFKNVSFGYTSNIEVLRNINFKLFKNQFVGIVGKTGSGKSTLVDLLIGLLKPNNGEIYVDSKKLDYHAQQNWSINFSSVSQNIFLIDDTIKNNIILGSSSEKIDKQRLNLVIKICEIEEFANNFDDKLDTYVGERGSKISGGQRQRIGIARAIYQNKPIIVLDESTNSLDKNTEDKIFSNIKLYAKDKTIIIISHNNANLKYCDLILHVENGRLLEADKKDYS